jgi:hypothetical protein
VSSTSRVNGKTRGVSSPWSLLKYPPEPARIHPEEDTTLNLSNLLHDSMRALAHAVDDLGDAVSAAVLLFAFGAVLLALCGQRMNKLELEVAARPARTFAIGVVGFVVSIALFVTLCVTLIGIPLAFIGAFAMILATYAGTIAVLTTAGAALVGHRTKNAYLHLGMGCAVFLVLGNIPFLGDYVTLALIFFAMGAVIASRAAGFWPTPNGQAPTFA